MGVAIAALWGFAEATLFFIVPDVWLSRLAITRGLRYATWAAIASAAGALAGGVVMLLWSMTDAPTAWRTVEAVPAISTAMMHRVVEQMGESGWIAMLFGTFSGVPYKSYAVQVVASELPVWTFLLATIPVRLSRFLLVVVIAWGVANRLEKPLGKPAVLGVWAVGWIGFYALFFWFMPG